MDEFKPYSFEPMREDSEFEEESVENQRRTNRAICECHLCVNWEDQQKKRMFMLPRN